MIIIIINYILGITSPPYRRTLCEWFQFLTPYLPQCCRRTSRSRSKTVQTTAQNRVQASGQNTPQQTRLLSKRDNEPNVTKEFNNSHSSKLTLNDGNNRNLQKECISLIPR